MLQVINRSVVVLKEFILANDIKASEPPRPHFETLSLGDIIFILTSQEHRAEIDARDSTFQAFEDFGKELLDKEHYASPDIREKLDTMAKEREELEKYVVYL